MKIGILTHFHKSTNYGGVLQAYALCKYLNDHGHSARQILYQHTVTKINTASVTPKEYVSKVVSRLKKQLYKKENQNIQKRMESLFWDFRDRVPHTFHEYTKDTIGDVANDFDAFITGSDQVWNPIWYDSSYMLDFVREATPKISYAASIGVGNLDREQQEIFRQLKGFRAISVREKAAANLLPPLVGQEVKVCVDPTLLLSADDWDGIASERKIDEKYVFLYFLGDDTKCRRLAQQFAKAKGMKLVLLPDLLGTYRKNDRKIHAEKVMDATPGDFVSLIKHGEYIFTDSFHACVFSLLYHKEFFAFPRAGAIQMESRIQTLTELFACPERFCADKKKRTLAHLLSLDAMDYTRMCDLFIKEKQKSMEYLENNLH